jgi:hypothetical protein
VTDVPGVLMIKMSRREALSTIKGLTAQLIANDPNTGRFEKPLDKDGRSFSIAVHPQGQEPIR